jgi:predicted dehydrogenase
VIAADAAERSARQAAEVLGCESWTLDYRELLTHPEVDVASICVSNFLHKEMALAPTEAGKPSG